MAAKEEKIKEAQVVTSQENNEAKNIKVPEVKVTAPKAKLVEVRYLVDGNSIIAGITYTYNKNKQGKVPTDVAAILVNGGVAIKL